MNSIIEAAHARRAAPVIAAAPRTLHLLQPHERARWDGFVRACPDATFFHLSGWQQVLEQSFGIRTWFYYVQQDGVILGVLPLAQIKSRLFGHSLGAMPFCVYGGVAAIDAAARAMLDSAAHELAQELGAGHLEYRGMRRAHPDDPAWHTKELYVTFRKAISGDDEENLNAIPRKQRAMVRKGIKLGLQGRVEDNVERMFAAYAHSVHRLGTPVFPKKYFALLQQTFGDECEVRVIETADGRLVAAVLSFYWRDEVVPYYGGGTDLAREVAGNDFMYWNLMQAAAARGCRLFDFGRSKLGTGAYDFKKNWGFTAEPLPYEYKLYGATSLPDNNPLNPKYQLFIKLWKKLPLPLANALGPHIVKNLG
ncbi:FemAB family XrtA/PEP-CTERM system-associated protein [Massilia yuzhufengensis]|uniref:FemAB-related protein, PEP-CTERM system-associated n=1 Tax=Massilia yuzhufengensis TaxID=1164594 RepID=A0A1I1DJS4_9BURK|nr:FemAB family XrtA/PEP-CTERM system-associated protein [Massilia yuzhufengensis]SFB75161.1 FemAB-related protein, PEP-CTERM system-associated [Massilia yuzhufengensis]